MTQILTPRWLLLAVVAVIAGVLALGAVACSDDGDDDGEEPTATEEAAPPELAQVAIDALEYTYGAPESIAGGLTEISVSNIGGEDHLAVFFRLDDGATFEQFQELLEGGRSESDLETLGTFVGGPGAEPGGEGVVVLDLDAGQYVLLCPIPSADGTPHFALGMIQPLEVTEAPAEQPEPPEADLTVTLSEFSFDAPDTLSAGTITIEAVNGGSQIHEMAVAKLSEGITPEQLLEVLSVPPGEGPPPEGPPPFTLSGGAFPMSAGESTLTTIDLTAGTYVMLCFVTDPPTRSPHFALGMFTSFTVE